MNTTSKIFTTVAALGASVVAGHAAENKTVSYPEKEQTAQTKDFEIAIKEGFTIADNSGEFGKGLSVRKHVCNDSSYFYSFTDSDNNPVTDELAIKRAKIKAASLAADGEKDMQNFELYTLMGKDNKPILDENGQQVKINPKSVDVKYAESTIHFNAAISMFTQGRGGK